MRLLLDINVLIALLDPDHAFHQRAHDWWGGIQPDWASCPLTENGLIRIMSSVSYSPNEPFTVDELKDSFLGIVANSNHVFLPDNISITDQKLFHHRRILSSKYLTDLYLLALASANDACLATFDQGISIELVAAAEPKHLLVL
ncbi:MAG: PIN domain-containing protein [Verrucomicrobia bacterium]|nr:PIN domain-containing protein [Verrucomicrobiota bacterium]